MRHRATGFCVGSWILLWGLTSQAIGDGAPNTEAEQIETIRGQAINRGFVILNGQYLPAPYVVGHRGDDLLINEHLMATEWFAEQLLEPGDDAGGVSTGWQEWRNHRQAVMVARLEKQLQKGALLLGLDRHTVGIVPFGREVEVLKLLTSDAPNEAKVEQLMESGVDWVNSAQWAKLVRTFQPTDNLIRRVRTTAVQRDHLDKEYGNRYLEAVSTASTASGWSTYGFNVTAMVLAVLAVGTLLSRGPPHHLRWNDVDSTGDGVSMVARNVILLLLLGVFDLGCTLLANQTGGAFELNPLGSRLAGNAVLLASFKTTSLLGACLILVMLRRYRGAQIASWWLCLLCTFVVFRWLSCNSLFLS